MELKSTMLARTEINLEEEMKSKLREVRLRLWLFMEKDGPIDQIGVVERLGQRSDMHQQAQSRCTLMIEVPKVIQTLVLSAGWHKSIDVFSTDVHCLAS